MASTVKACDQLPPIRVGCDILQHRILNKLAAGLRAKLGAAAPELQLKYGNKATSGHVVSAKLTGVIASPNPHVPAETEDKVRKLMDELRDQSSLTSLLRE